MLGRPLCSSLHSQGWKVIALNRTLEMGPWDESIQVDLASHEKFSIPSDIDVVYHLAGKAHALSETRQDEEEYFRINAEGTRRILEAAKARGVRRFVFFSSVKAMGEGGPDCFDESAPCHPVTPYGKSKLEAERMVLEGNYVPEPVVLRLTMVYGPTHKGNLPRMIDAVSKGRFPPIPEFGNKRSMVHVQDVAQAALLAAEKPEATGQTYLVTDGRPCSTRELYEWICQALDKPVPTWRIPKGVFCGLAKLGDGIGKILGRRFPFDSDTLEKLAGSARYDSQKIVRELGFQAKYHLRESLPEIIQFLRLPLK
ncbi:MAG: NAD-dependent epimerase/dehydratase family protein [Nitrospinaceae bacterium]|nr:NAD-dependent epimerase/dehydratase family protein [Nitrospinaceae bacterium]NIR56265.1 NAD-dependent epimerase/dehydratase family protein [Nitrospinaceae bacterium]NIS86721.1 NAD-dependent epimerase/dehydratase family protein [Nitrospinaceae bacterium]NIT83554.1 NAD-dependent epimerase/dehydratase family protein [Nitrospinaceae bacterium]NIU45759.1 NAD-dependent epimerase/dehydratase family protein [Nitrospinaceae bacterium]